MDKCFNDITLTRGEAVEGILSKCRFSPESEDIPVMGAFGRVLARDVRAKHTLPSVLASARDGVAVRFACFADGIPDTREWVKGKNYTFSNTGIGLPDGFDTVVPIEHIFFDEEYRICFSQGPECKGQLTIPAGTEMRTGELLARAGQTMTPTILAQLVKGGYTEIPVIRRPVVAFLPTGNELAPPGAPLPEGKHVDANSTLIYGKLLEAGAEPLMFPISRDDHGILYRALRRALSAADIVLINGGSSKGTEDFTHEILNSMGVMLNQQVETAPGKHTSYTMIGDTPVVGLSGPTVCCDYTFDWYVRPLIDRFLGRADTQFPTMRVRAFCNMVSDRRRMVFMMSGRLILDDQDQPVVIPAALLGKVGMAEDSVNCFIPLMPGEEIGAGEWVDVELRWPFIAPKREPDALARAREALLEKG